MDANTIFKEFFEVTSERIQTIYEDVKMIKCSFVMGEDLVLDIYDVAQALKCTDRYVHMLIKRGEIKGFKMGSRRLFLKSEIQAFIDEKVNKSNLKSLDHEK
ncbi:MAG: helix-turn-helix domain-containing protein [Alistipes sp.]|nr:helix-turn-helix domain-containing protein [Alistipes sp.]